MKTIDDSNAFEQEVAKQKGVVLVDFYTDGCPPCRMMAPVLEETSLERADVKIVKVNAAINTEVSSRYRVTAVPTFILFRDGEAKAQFIGARSKKDLLTWIDSNI
jgi:thioredoxin 1